jgi:hypothetical protein
LSCKVLALAKLPCPYLKCSEEVGAGLGTSVLGIYCKAFTRRSGNR